MVMVPAPAGGRMGGCETTPPGSRTGPGKPASPADASPQQTTTQQAFLTCDHRPPLAGVKLVRPRQRPDGRQRLRALQLDPGPARRHGTSSCEENPAQQPIPGDLQVTGSRQHALLTEKAPMGGVLGGIARSERRSRVCFCEAHYTRSRVVGGLAAELGHARVCGVEADGQPGAFAPLPALASRSSCVDVTGRPVRRRAFGRSSPAEVTFGWWVP
jgi:hypothetical protein